MPDTLNRLPALPELPISAYRAEFEAALGQGSVLLEAEPGAGKSTLTPLWALAMAPVGQAVWLVQPRVLAAQAVAARLADLRGEPLGQSVGYQVPYDSRCSDATRLLVMTPGVLLQHLLADPLLDGVATVMLDEIHERSVNQDTAWAWLQEAAILREDLALVLMSATPDPTLQQQADTRLFAPGRCFPVAVDYVPAKISAGRTEALSEHLLRALAIYPRWKEETVLVFLPGWREIEAAAGELARRYPGHRVLRLHSRVPPAEQRQALDPAQGPRLILATNIAETSLTIADVTLVVDSGLVRRPSFEQRTGISRLSTGRVSRASAEQRRGRAGRVQAGHCLRLWPQDQALAAADLPEIRVTDYLPLTLRLGHWAATGSAAEDLPWIEAPNPTALTQARERLQRWGLMDAEGLVTEAGAQVSALGTHPRIAALLQSQLEKGRLPEHVLSLALALHFDLPAGDDVEGWLAQAKQEAGRHPHWRQQRQRWLRVLQAELAASDLDPVRLAQVMSDRIGYRQSSGRYRLNSGISVSAGKLDSDWALIPQVRSQGKGHVGAGLALTLDLATQKALSEPVTELIHKGGRWQARCQWLMGGQVVTEALEPLAPEAVGPALCARIVREGVTHFPWSEAAQRLLARARLAEREGLADIPALDDARLLATLDTWLLPFISADTRPDSLPWHEALSFYLGYEVKEALDRWLPEQVILPSGRSVRVSYPEAGLPEISAKLQEFFGCEALRLAEGRVALRIHLASPNGSPLAITADLASFWRQAYPQVRKDMRGRYPKHPWPEDPLGHAPTALTKRRLGQEE
ncbi:ATP-dependent helicase HrpB [Marinimicrobium alkaliphilum]|uniref:ATP-dependent helicase HrpB n=1 Tax=Marinimicrobium alkaliphilum TaxID=2202654 RepID=UPI000DB9B7ED|nr:ATP-dependent helicase HrpB [Marinimicrobium alkaliphilum]